MKSLVRIYDKTVHYLVQILDIYFIEYLKTINLLKILYEKLNLINMYVESIIHSNFTLFYIQTRYHLWQQVLCVHILYT